MRRDDHGCAIGAKVVNGLGDDVPPVCVKGSEGLVEQE